MFANHPGMQVSPLATRNHAILNAEQKSDPVTQRVHKCHQWINVTASSVATDSDSVLETGRCAMAHDQRSRIGRAKSDKPLA